MRGLGTPRQLFVSSCGAGVGRALAVQAAEDIDLDRAVLEGHGDGDKSWHVDEVDVGHFLERDGMGEFDPQCPSAGHVGGAAVTEWSIDPSGMVVRSYSAGAVGTSVMGNPSKQRDAWC